MASTLVDHLSGDRSLPPLSPNYRTTQLLTPRHLERITIDQPHYQGHLLKSIGSTQLPNLDAVERRVGTMGDSYFFLQKELPVHQTYAKTSLQLSQVRPWDQIVERPLKSSVIINKEVHLPFPQEHPYTSHISRFAVFPDTSAESSHIPSSAISLADAQTQTFPGIPNAPYLYQVPQKAGAWGQRVECRYMSTPTDIKLESGMGKMLWDLPRSQKHVRANTYPAPSLQFSRPQTAAKYIPLPSVINPSTLGHPPITPSTQEGLNSIHKMLTRTTTYGEQFGAASKTSRGAQNTFKLNYTFRSRESQRPWTAESRGKYSQMGGITTMDVDYRALIYQAHSQDPNLNDPSDIPTSKEQDFQTTHSGYISEQRAEDKQMEPLESCHQEKETENLQESAVGLKLVDACTQTEEEYFLTAVSPSLDQQMNKLPALISDVSENSFTPLNHRINTAIPLQQSDSRPTDTLPPRMLKRLPSFSNDIGTPRTVGSTRKLMGLFNGFNRTDILKRFHKYFPENAPDLRTYSIREGKRHSIHGSNSYYFH